MEFHHVQRPYIIPSCRFFNIRCNKAKSLFFFTHFAAINVLLILVLAIVLKVPPHFGVAAVLMVAANTALVDLVGHFVSILLPFTYRARGRRVRAVMPQMGCSYVVMYTLVFHLASIVVLPSSAALALGTIFLGWPGLIAGAAVAGLIVYGAYRFGLPYAAHLLVTREPELVATLSKAQD